MCVCFCLILIIYLCHYSHMIYTDQISNWRFSFSSLDWKKKKKQPMIRMLSTVGDFVLCVIRVYQCTCQHMCFCEPAPALWPHCWWIHPWRWRPAEGTSAAWAVGTPRTAPPAGWCLACQLSSSGRTHTPALEWPEEQCSRDAIRPAVKVGEASIEQQHLSNCVTSPVQTYTYDIKMNPLFDIRWPNYPVRAAENWISASLIKREQTRAR